MAAVLAFLRDVCRLPDAAAYHARLLEEGYETLDLLALVTRDILCDDVGMKNGHARICMRTFGALG